MNRLSMTAALLAGSALGMTAPAFAAQEQAAAQEPSEPDASDTTADETIAAATQLDQAQSQIELLQAQVEALQESIEQVKSQMVKATPSWKGAPQWEDKDEGWSFKPRGRIQYDAGFVSEPDNIVNRNLGFNTRARRLRLGAEGTIPGGFGYKCEMDFANSSVGSGCCWASGSGSCAHAGAEMQSALPARSAAANFNFIS